MLGRVPDAISVIRPIRDGVISDFEVTRMMLRHFIRKACGPRSLTRPRIVVCVPSGSTSIEKRAVAESATSVGAGEVHLVDQAIAAAIGAGLPVTEPAGSMMVDIGGGTTEIAVISLSGLVYSQSLRIAGDKFDEAIIQLLRRRYNIQIGERTAEIVKIMVGSAASDAEVESFDIKARHLTAREPRTVKITSADIREAIAGPSRSWSRRCGWRSSRRRRSSPATSRSGVSPLPVRRPAAKSRYLHEQGNRPAGIYQQRSAQGGGAWREPVAGRFDLAVDGVAELIDVDRWYGARRDGLGVLRQNRTIDRVDSPFSLPACPPKCSGALLHIRARSIPRHRWGEGARPRGIPHPPISRVSLR